MDPTASRLTNRPGPTQQDVFDRRNPQSRGSCRVIIDNTKKTAILKYCIRVYVGIQSPYAARRRMDVRRRVQHHAGRMHEAGATRQEGGPCGRTRARAAMRTRVHVARIQRLASASLKRKQSTTRARPSALTRRSPGPALTPLTTALLWFSAFFFFPHNNVENT